jgi:hypothetical protein
MRAFGIFGLALVLLAILVLGPYVKRFTEGFADAAPTDAAPPSVTTSTMTPSELKEKVIEAGNKIIQLNKFLEDPTIDSATKEKIVKEKETLQQEIEKLSGQPLPSAEIQAEPKKEGFVGILSSDLEKQTRGSDLIQEATHSAL